MASSATGTRTPWSARLLIALALLLAGAAIAAWGFGRFDGAARFFGIGEPRQPPPARSLAPAPQPFVGPQARRPPPTATADRAALARIAELEARVDRVEGAAQRVEGAAGRADALLVAFAARRALDRGAPLGVLEPLLLQRFGNSHPGAVATIVTASHAPVRLADLVSEYADLGPTLRSSAAQDGWWTQFKREIGTLVKVRRADRPSMQPDARYLRARTLLAEGEVDAALAETMRLPGAERAAGWVARARRYVAAQQALDDIETAALVGRAGPAGR